MMNIGDMKQGTKWRRVDHAHLALGHVGDKQEYICEMIRSKMVLIEDKTGAWPSQVEAQKDLVGWPCLGLGVLMLWQWRLHRDYIVLEGLAVSALNHVGGRFVGLGTKTQEWWIGRHNLELVLRQSKAEEALGPFDQWRKIWIVYFCPSRVCIHVKHLWII